MGQDKMAAEQNRVMQKWGGLPFPGSVSVELYASLELPPRIWGGDLNVPRFCEQKYKAWFS